MHPGRKHDADPLRLRHPRTNLLQHGLAHCLAPAHGLRDGEHIAAIASDRAAQHVPAYHRITCVTWYKRRVQLGFQSSRSEGLACRGQGMEMRKANDVTNIVLLSSTHSFLAGTLPHPVPLPSSSLASVFPVTLSLKLLRVWLRKTASTCIMSRSLLLV